MPDASSTEHAVDAREAGAAPGAHTPNVTPVFDIAPRRRAAMVAMGYVPLLHAGSVGLLAAAPLLGWGPAWLTAVAIAVLYLLPPVVVRVSLLMRPLGAGGRFALDSPRLMTWWFTAQWQVLFNRVPILEELLRLVPGLYSAWMRLWGARVGRFVYWSAGVTVLDRAHVRIGHNVILGVGARLHPHVIDRRDTGQTELLLAPIDIGDDTLVGGMSLLTAGVTADAGQVTPAVYALPPFTRWRDGKRHRAGFTLIR